MPFSVYFDQITESVTISISVGGKQFVPEAFDEIVNVIMNLYGKPVKKVVILLGDVLQRHKLEMKGVQKSESYKTSLEDGKKWIKDVKDSLKKLVDAGIPVSIVPWFKLIFKDPESPIGVSGKEEDKNNNSIYLNFDYNNLNNIDKEFEKYSSFDPDDEKNLNPEFLEWKQFIQDLYGQDSDDKKIQDSNDKKISFLEGQGKDDVAPIKRNISKAALNFNARFLEDLTPKEQANYRVDNGVLLSTKYIVEEIVNFLRSPKLELPHLYYPYSNNTVAQPVTDATIAIVEFIEKYQEKILMHYPNLAELLDQTKQVKMINFTCRAGNKQTKPKPVKHPSKKPSQKQNVGKVPKELNGSFQDESKLNSSALKSENDMKVEHILEAKQKIAIADVGNEKVSMVSIPTAAVIPTTVANNKSENIESEQNADVFEKDSKKGLQEAIQDEITDSTSLQDTWSREEDEARRVLEARNRNDFMPINPAVVAKNGTLESKNAEKIDVPKNSEKGSENNPVNSLITPASNVPSLFWQTDDTLKLKFQNVYTRLLSRTMYYIMQNNPSEKNADILMDSVIEAGGGALQNGQNNNPEASSFKK